MKKIITSILFLVFAGSAFGRGDWVCEATGDDGRFEDYYESRCSETREEAARDALRDCRRDFDRRECQLNERRDCWHDQDCRRNDGNTGPGTFDPSLGQLQEHCNCNTGKRCYMRNGVATQCIYECQNGYRFPNNPTVFSNAQCTVVR